MLGPKWRGVCVSEGTLKATDLVERFKPVLEEIADLLRNANQPESAGEIAELIEAADKAVENVQKVQVDPDQAESYILDLEFVVEEMFEKLNEYAPEGCYFGASEGDGACFGFWTCNEDEDEN